MKKLSSIVAISLLSLGCIFSSGSNPAQANGMAPEACTGVVAELGQEGYRVDQVNDLTRQRRIGKAVVMQPSGAQLFVRAEAGMSAPYLQRMIDCQLAQGQGSGPLAVPGVKATVQPQGQHFVVQILAPDVASAREVQQRARTLASR